jgi:hypothetical protein
MKRETVDRVYVLVLAVLFFATAVVSCTLQSQVNRINGLKSEFAAWVVSHECVHGMNPPEKCGKPYSDIER